MRFKEDLKNAGDNASAGGLSDEENMSMQCVKRTRDVRDFGKLQQSKRRAQAIIEHSTKDMSNHLMDRLKARKLAKAQKKRKIGAQQFS